MNNFYNPASRREDRLPAKVWELLRRNPTFRLHAEFLLNPARAPELGLRSLSDNQKFLAATDWEHPIAAYALRWLFKPEFIDTSDIDSLLRVGTFRSKQDQILCLFPYLDDQLINGIAKMGWKKLCDVFPIYLWRTHFTNWTSEWAARSKTAMSLGPLLDERDRTKYERTGPLQLFSDGFNLETPWNKTPELFQKHFRWLWANYDYSAPNPYTGDRSYFINPTSTAWVLQQILDEPDGFHNLRSARAAQLRFFAENFQFSLSLPNLLYTQRNIEVILEDFKKLYRIYPFPVWNNATSTIKYLDLLGSTSEWKDFICCYEGVGDIPGVRFEVKPSTDPGMSFYHYNAWGLSRVRAALAQRERGKTSEKKSRLQGHIKNHYQRMENLMIAMYPHFSIFDLVRLSSVERPDACRYVVHTGQMHASK